MRTALLLILVAAVQESPGIAARVNDEIITTEQLRSEVRKIPKMTEEVRKRVLRDLAEDLLLQQEARRHNLGVTEEEITARIQSEIKRFESEEKFVSSLLWTGLTVTQFREKVRKDVLIGRLHSLIRMTGHYGKGPVVLVDEVSPEEVRESFRGNPERYRAYSRVTFHRLCIEWKTEAEKPAKRRLAESLRRRLLEGYNFGLLAQWYSDGGMVEFKDMPREDKLFSPSTMKYLFDELKPEDRSSPIIEDGNYFNLFILRARSEQREIPFEEAQHRIRLELRSQLAHRNSRLIIKELASRAYYWPDWLFQ